MFEATTPIRRDDYGFFGPGSPSWKVWASPTSLIGFQRAVVLEHFDPFLAAAVADSAGIYTDPRGTSRPHPRVLPHRGRRRRPHRDRGVRRPDAGARQGQGRRADHRLALQRQQSRRSALDPRHRLAFGAEVLRALRAGPTVEGRGERYWAESRIAAELQTCKPSDVPASRDEVRQYFADVRPRLCTSEHADKAMRYLLWTPRDRGVRLWAGSRLLAPAAIATLPKWMRHMGDFDQPAAVDAAVTPAARAMVLAMSVRDSRPLLAAARQLVPHTAAVLAQHLDAGPPAMARTVDPAEVRERLVANA